MSLVIYTDGACSGNPGPGGWAWAVSPTGKPSGFGSEPDTTNQRMELLAVINALRTYADSAEAIEIVSDSTYVVHCFRDKWWMGWQRRGWKNSQRQPVANRDLWEPLIELVTSRTDISFTWVKAHNGEPMNELVDQLAVAASLSTR
ncbi:MAG: ribonuclease HI [Ilumatobacteraceae bacterium]|jgi:ribonuclease HI|nr:ribonuclease HI [Ilumatobacteraceae bacterium]